MFFSRAHFNPAKRRGQRASGAGGDHLARGKRGLRRTLIKAEFVEGGTIGRVTAARMGPVKR